jgi:TPR repeat protein
MEELRERGGGAAGGNLTAARDEPPALVNGGNEVEGRKDEESKTVDAMEAEDRTINAAFGVLGDGGTTAWGDGSDVANIDAVMERARGVERLCNSLADVKVKSLPDFRETLKAFIAHVGAQVDIIKEYTGLNDLLDTSLRSLQSMLVECFKVLTACAEASMSANPFVRSRLNSKFRNKIGRCQANLQGLENRLFNTIHSELYNARGNVGMAATTGPSTTSGPSLPRSRGASLSAHALQPRPQAEEWCLTGDRYFSGLGVAQSYPLAFRNYLRSAKAGMPRAMNCAGCMLQHGRGTAANLDEAEAWFRQATALNDADGMNNLGMLLEDRVAQPLEELLEGNAPEARASIYATMREVERLFLDAAGEGHVDAMNNLGHMYLHAARQEAGGVKYDLKKAIQYFQMAAEQGYAKAQTNLGSLYYSGRGTTHRGPDYAKAVAWFTRAAEQGDPIAQNNLGICYEMGRGVPKNYVAATELYAKAAAQSNPSGMNNWGYMLVRQVESVGGTEDAPQYVKAAELFRAAIAAGDGFHADPHSAFHEGGLLVAGAARKQNRRDMSNCSADASFNLASLYEAGYGVTRDLPAAFQYYTKAAAVSGRGHTRAATRAAAMLYSGSGTTRNFILAKQYYLMAASKGDSEAENALGIMIEEGLGDGDPDVPGIADPKEAAKWYRRAGQQGNAYAFLNLARLHVRGVGVEKSVTFAKHLLELAADAGLHEAQVERDRLNTLKTDEKIEELNSYLGLIDFAEHDFDLDRVRKTAEIAQQHTTNARVNVSPSPRAISHSTVRFPDRMAEALGVFNAPPTPPKEAVKAEVVSDLHTDPGMGDLEQQLAELEKMVQMPGTHREMVDGMEEAGVTDIDAQNHIRAAEVQAEDQTRQETEDGKANDLARKPEENLAMEDAREKQSNETVKGAGSKQDDRDCVIEKNAINTAKKHVHDDEEVVEEEMVSAPNQASSPATSSPALPPREITPPSQTPASPPLPPRARDITNTVEEPPVPERPKRTPRRTPASKQKKAKVRYENPAISQDARLFKDRLEDVRDEYGEGTLEEATAQHNVGKVYAKIVEHNMKLDPDNTQYKLGVEEAAEYYTAALETRRRILGSADHLVVKSYKALAKLYGRLGEGHAWYSKSGEYAHEAMAIVAQLKQDSD